MPDAPAPRTPDDAAAPSADDLRDRALVTRIARGDDAAFEQLVRLHRPRLLRIAERVVDGGRAEDAVQVALLRAYEAFRRGEVPRQPAAWLSAAARNAAIDQHRRHGPVDPVAAVEAMASAPSVAAVAESRAELRRVLGDVAALPPNERDALLLRATTGAGHDAIGDHLAVSPGQARQLLHRARRRLREVAAILLPAWLALRVSQAKAAVANAAAAPGESLLGAKSTAVVIAAAASIGGGTVAVQAHRSASQPSKVEASAAGAGGAAAADAHVPQATFGPDPARTVLAAAQKATGQERASAQARSRQQSARTGDAEDASGDSPAPTGPPTQRDAAPVRPATSTGGGADDHEVGDDHRRPSGSSGSSGSGSGSGSGSSGSSNSGAAAPSNGAGASGGSGATGSGSSDDDGAGDESGSGGSSTATAATAGSDDDVSESGSDDHAEDSEASSGRSEEVE